MTPGIGYTNVAEAGDGTIALPMLRNGSFDVLITDWNMPGMPGLELLRQVRSDPELTKLRVLILTPEAKREQVIEAAKAGVDSYAVKPFTPAALKEQIEKALVGETRSAQGRKSD